MIVFLMFNSILVQALSSSFTILECHSSKQELLIFLEEVQICLVIKQAKNNNRHSIFCASNLTEKYIYCFISWLK